MKLIKNLKEIKQPYNNAVVTIGNFDGVHLGHRVLFDKVISEAKKINGTSVVITFHPHPLQVLKCRKLFPLITQYEQKIELIKESKIDILISIPFTLEFASIEAEDFLQKILIETIGMKTIIVGEDYTFGKARKGNLAFLKSNAKDFNYDVKVINNITSETALHQRISSTKIREMIAEGKVFEARKLLGRFYQIIGKVVSGRSRGGSLLGFPTANISLTDQLTPAIGVYAVTVEYLGNTPKIPSVANIGVSPTFGDNIFTIEVHIIDFNKDIYNKKLCINFIKRIREEKKFSELAKLSEQIKNDIKKAKEIIPSWHY